MSKGLGRVQKRVLRQLGTRKWKKIADLDQAVWCCNSVYMAIYRAIKTLESRGLVETRLGVAFGQTILGNYAASVLMVRKIVKCKDADINA